MKDFSKIRFIQSKLLNLRWKENKIGVQNPQLKFVRK